MKYVCIIMFLVCFYTSFGQIKGSNFAVRLELNQPTYKLVQEKPSKYLVQQNYWWEVIEGKSNVTLSLEYILTKRLTSSFSVFYQQYYNQWLLTDRIFPISGGIGFLQEDGFHFQPGINYNIWNYRNKFNLRVGLHYVYLRGQFHIGKISGNSTSRDFVQGTDILFQAETLDFKNITYGLRKNFHFAKVNAVLDFRVYKWFSLSGQISYQQGFVLLSSMRGQYRYFNDDFPNGSEWIPFQNDQYGTVLSVAIGLKYDFGLNDKSNNPIDQ